MSLGDTDIYSRIYEELVRSIRSAGKVDQSWVPTSADVKYEYKWDVPGASAQEACIARGRSYGKGRVTRKSVEGLSMYLFIFAYLGNFFYVAPILTSRRFNLPEHEASAFLCERFFSSPPLCLLISRH